MYCSVCGKEAMDKAVICPSCGCMIKKENIKPNEPYSKTINKTKTSVVMILIITLSLFLCSCSREKCDVCDEYGANHIVEAITTWNLCDDCYEIYKNN